MIRKVGIGAAAAAVALSSLATTSTASAQAYTTSFTTSVTYQNVGTATANISMQFYPQGSGTAVTLAVSPLAAKAGTSVFLGNVSSVNAGFVGSAVLSADQPVVATMVQVPQGSATVKNRPLANGFSSGAAKYLIATVLKNKFNTTTKFSVQNVDTEALNLTVTFYSADTAAAPVAKTVAALPAGSASYFDAGAIAELPAGFNGSAQITAKKADGTPGNVVAAALELSTNGPAASAFEGISTSSAKYYMASAVCNYQGSSSAYAVQNTGDDGAADASVTVTYNNGKTETQTIAVGKKASFLGCTPGNPAGFLGSAVIQATGNKIVAVGKVTGGGLSTAFLGAAQGAPKLALPYVRWTQAGYNGTAGRQRVFIAIQNVGSANLAAGTVKVQYLDRDGKLVGTDTMGAIAQNAKVNSNANNVAGGAEFGWYGGSNFGGSVIIEGPAGSQLTAIARVKSNTSNTATATEVGEDYNAIPIE